jgi:hypothetical protein
VTGLSLLREMSPREGWWLPVAVAVVLAITLALVVMAILGVLSIGSDP